MNNNEGKNSSGSESIAVYPGTFDPVTNGHLDIINRALNIFDRVIVVIALNPDKKQFFTLEERLKMIRDCFGPDEDRVKVAYTSGLLVDFVSQNHAKAIIRGLRAVSDFEHEFQLALMNRKIMRNIDTVFLMTGLRWIYISSSIIKDVARHGGDVSGMVPLHVTELFNKRFKVNGRASAGMRP